MKKENEILEILENIIQDFNNKWTSGEEQNDGLVEYAKTIKNLFLSDQAELLSEFACKLNQVPVDKYKIYYLEKAIQFLDKINKNNEN